MNEKLKLLGGVLLDHAVHFAWCGFVLLIPRFRNWLLVKIISGTEAKIIRTEGMTEIEHKESEMVKAFDIADLVARLKAKGMPMVEADAKIATQEIFAWAEDSCALKGGFFAVAVPLLPLVAAQVVALEDKIDGVVGN